VCIRTVAEIPQENFVGDFNAKVGREYIFKQTIANDSLHGISDDNGVKVENVATSKKYNCQRVQCSHITTFINTLELLLVGKNRTRLIITSSKIKSGIQIYLMSDLLEELTVILNIIW
jgi:hypothetical protein